MAAKTNSNPVEKDFLWLNIKELPFFRALLRAVEARFYQDILLPSPTIDLGCGDGHFAEITFNSPVDIGLDPDIKPLWEAIGRNSYRFLIQADGSCMPFPDHYFNSAFSNSVLEHIPGIEAVLKETSRVLKPGAVFAFCVPNHQFNQNLSISNWFERINAGVLADRYRTFFDRIARHYHLDPPEVWINRLQKAGFEIVRWHNYFSPGALRITELGHYFGLPSLLARKLFGKWILAPFRWNLAIPYRITKKYFDQEPIRDDGVCTFFITRRK